MHTAGLALFTLGAAALMAGCAPADGSVRARRLTADDIHPEHEAERARPGDVVLENELVRFVITGSRGSDSYADRAGIVIDATLVREPGEPAYDGLDELTPLVNGCPIDASSISISRDGAGGGAAEVRVVGRDVAIPYALAMRSTVAKAHGLDLEVRYMLSPGERMLRVLTTVTNPNREAVPLVIGDFLNMGSDEADAFTLPGGYDYLAAITAPDVIGSAHESLPWAVAMFSPLQPIALVAGATVGDLLGAGDEGLVQTSLIDEMLAPGATRRVTRYLALGRDIAEAVAPRLGLTGVARGNVDGIITTNGEAIGDARVSFFDAGGEHGFAGQALSDPSGHYHARLPAGEYSVLVTGRGNGQHVEVPGRPRVLLEGVGASSGHSLTVKHGTTAPLNMELGPGGRLPAQVRDERGQRLPFKLSFQVEGEVPAIDPALGERMPYPSLGITQVFWSRGDDLVASVVPGTYTVTASHGPMYTLDVRRGVVIRPGDNEPLTFALARQAPALGYVAIDSHLHAMDSQHGEATRAERAITAAAEGLDVAVATDHDRIVDYGPTVASLGLGEALLPIPGVEMGTPDAGHHTIWPLRFDAQASLGGAERWWLGGSIDTLYGRYAAKGGVVFQVAHGKDYFTRAGFEPASSEAEESSSFTFGFNAMELHNGKRGGGRDFLVPTWYTLLAIGHRVAPLAASDSHRRIPEPGSARTYVWLGDRERSAANVAEAVVAMHTVASTGPLVELSSVDGAVHVGDSAQGPLRVRIAVWAPPWMPIARVRLVASGFVAASWDAGTTPAVATEVEVGEPWFEHELELAPAAPTWYAVEVEGDGDLAPVFPAQKPWAHTAPVFVSP